MKDRQGKMGRRVCAGWRMRQHIWRMAPEAGIVLAALAVALWIFCGGAEKGDPYQPQIAEKILRFHVIANSDSAEDQRVKLAVRDAVGGFLAPRLQEAGTLAESRRIVEENLDGIIETAYETVRAEGYDYPADACLARVGFPEKTYGEYTFPAGEYEALEVILGEGDGHNWWCVLYPNMCFRGSVYEIIDEDAKRSLREVLTPEEYADVFEKGHVSVRLKFLEHFRKNS